MKVRIPIRAVVVCALAATTCACSLSLARDAENAAKAYSHAYNNHDVDTMVTLLDPEELKRSHSGQDIRELWPRIFASGSGSMKIKGISRGFTDSTGMHYFVTKETSWTPAHGQAMVEDNYFIVTSRDLGGTWTLADVGRVDERWVRGIAPGWNGYPQLPTQAVRTAGLGPSAS